MIQIHIEKANDVEAAIRLDGFGTEFHDVLARLKALPKRRFDPKLKMWFVPLAHDSLHNLLSTFPRADLGPELNHFLDSKRKRTNLELELEKIKLRGDADITDYNFGKTPPMAHQRASFEVLRRLQNGANWSQMGVGKSFVSAHISKYRIEHGLIKNILVVCPKSVLSVWGDPETGELVKHGVAKPKDILLLEGPTDWCLYQMLNKPHVWCITNYEKLWRLLKQLDGGIQYDMIIADESTKIKNHSTKAFKGMMKIGKLAKFRIAMSGQPIEQSPLDAWAQCEWVEPGALGYSTFYEFQNDFSIVVRTKQVGNAKIPVRRAWQNLDKLQRLIERFSVRFTKAQCITLPEQVFTTRECEMTGDQLEAYNKVKEDFLLVLKDDKVTVPNMLSQITRLHQVTSGHIGTDDKKIHVFKNQAKLDLLSEILDGGLTNGTKAVILARFLPDISMISTALKSKGIPHVTFFGETQNRGEVLKEFQTGPARVFVAQIETGSMGIDLTAANLCIYYSNTFRYGAREQSESRLHRKGQSNKVTYIDIIATQGFGPRGGKRETIDSRIYNTLRQKRDLANVINGDDMRKWVMEQDKEK